MYINLKKLRENGVEFDFNKADDSVTFQAEVWNRNQINAFQRLAKELNLRDGDCDEAAQFLSNLSILGAIKRSAQ